MSKVILIGGLKGGSGKTTIAINTAANLSLNGHNKNIILIDSDKQGSASSWAAIRDKFTTEHRVTCFQKFGKGLPGDVNSLREKYDFIVIDCGGYDSLELRGAMAVADFLFSPILASQLDVWTLSDLDELYTMCSTYNPNLKAHLIINRISPNPRNKDGDSVKDLVKDFKNFKLLKSSLSERLAFRRSAQKGQCVFEYEPIDKKANKEFKVLFDEMFYKTKLLEKKELISV